jgi:release factor glutamine methyltransferase
LTAARLDSSLSVASARRRLAQSFRRERLASPELDARLLVAHALGLDHAALATQADRKLAPAEQDAIDALAARRIKREPVARILGIKEFWGLPFRLNAATLVPRPETETVVEAALAAVAPRANRPLTLADFGTGSGVLLAALLAQWPDARGIGTDVSIDALACARANAAALGLAGRAWFVAGDYGQALAGPFDLIVSNPPYVASEEIAALEPEVRAFDPRRALDGGLDGLDAYRAIARGAQRLLARGGVMVLELGAGQLAAVENLLAAEGLFRIGPARPDLAGIPRALAVGRGP